MRYYDALLNALGVGIVTEDEYTSEAVLSKILDVDGAASGLDADLLDGHDSDFFVPMDQVGTLTGPKGDTGLQGPQGDPGAAGADAVRYVFSKLSIEVPYSYSLLLLGGKWIIRRWDQVTLTVMTASGNSGSTAAWSIRTSLIYT